MSKNKRIMQLYGSEVYPVSSWVIVDLFYLAKQNMVTVLCQQEDMNPN